MKKVLSRLAIVILLLQTSSPVSVFANHQIDTNKPLLVNEEVSIEPVIDKLTENQWLRQIVQLPEHVNQDKAEEIIRELEKYEDNVLEGLAINNAKIKLVESLEGLADLPEGTDGTTPESHLTSNNILYLKLAPSNPEGSAHFVLQKAALLMNSAIFNNIFASSTYQSYYDIDKGLASYGTMDQIEFFAESLGYYTYPDPHATELGKTVHAVLDLHSLYFGYEPKKIYDKHYYINQIVDYPEENFNQTKANAIVKKLETFDPQLLQGLAMNSAKLKLVDTLHADSDIPDGEIADGKEAYLISPNKLLVEIDGVFNSSWSSDELLRQMVLWVDASLWYKTAESTDFKHVYEYSYSSRNFATQHELDVTEFFSEAVVRHLNGQSLSGEKMVPVLQYISNHLLQKYKPTLVDYDQFPVGHPDILDDAENKQLDTLMPQVIEITKGATNYDRIEVMRIIERLKHFGSEIFQGMVLKDIKIRLTTGPITDEPEMNYLADVTPRGWPEDKTWADVPGAGGNPVFSRIGYSYYGMGHSTVNLELHETAHVLDHYLFNHISETDEWIELHTQEAANIFGNDGYMSAYPEEYFAEVSAYYFLSGHKRAQLERLAPGTYQFINGLYTNYKAIDPFDPITDAEKEILINQVLITKRITNQTLKKNVVKELKKFDLELLKGLVGSNIKYPLEEIGKTEVLKNITTVNPILNQVARDIDQYVLKSASKTDDFRKIFDKEAHVVNQPKIPKSLFWNQPFIAENPSEYFAEVMTMFYDSGPTNYEMGNKAPRTWSYLEELSRQYKWDQSDPPNLKEGNGNGGNRANRAITYSEKKLKQPISYSNKLVTPNLPLN